MHKNDMYIVFYKLLDYIILSPVTSECMVYE